MKREIITTKQMIQNFIEKTKKENISIQDISNKTKYEYDDINDILSGKLLIPFQEWQYICNCINIDFYNDIFSMNFTPKKTHIIA